MIKFDLITIFPKIFDSYFGESILKRAQKNKKIKIKVHDLRDFSNDKHKNVDDKPYGGGVGMVMQVQPIAKCLKKIKKKNSRVILLSAKGKVVKQKDFKRWTSYDNLILISGRYEGVDERVKKYIDEEISIGEYVLTGGELGSMIIIDGVSRLLPGVLGKDKSSEDESYSDGKTLEYPQYTRPEEYEGFKVPKVLLSGDHQKIKEWRDKKRG